MTDPPATSPLLASRYRLVRKLAYGGMAEVWLAWDEQLGRKVAVKVLKEQLASDPVATERFRREALAVASVEHPNVVAVYDRVDFNGQQAVVMQFVQGESLREVLDAQRQLDVDVVLRIATAVASALDAAHSAGLVHRDVKPGNILIADDGQILVTDFGIAKATEGGDDLTSENVMMGTAKYLSPEQVRGDRLDGRADLYSLGLVLYECLAGRVPFKGKTDTETALARVTRDPTPLGKMRPLLPSSLIALIESLLSRTPSKRPSTGAEVCAAVARIQSGAADIAPWPRLDERAAQRAGNLPRQANARDRAATPVAGTPRRRPANASLQRRRPSPLVILIAGLLTAALVAGLVLWSALRNSPSTRAATEVSGSNGSGAAGASNYSGAKVSAIATFDPFGDKTENADQVKLAKDGDPDTAWLTSCYQNQYFGAKQGVGVIVRLSDEARGVLTMQFPNAPWNVDIYAANSPFAAFESWGSPVAQAAQQKSTSTSVTLDRSQRYLLLMLREVGRDSDCNSQNPFRGGFSEITFGAAPA
ncbi:MAG: hypothetical protein RL219_75 [Actinomycetota bacterium]